MKFITVKGCTGIGAFSSCVSVDFVDSDRQINPGLSPFHVANDLQKGYYYPGDTLSFTVLNTTSRLRSYSVEVCNADTALQAGNTFANEWYTASFNKDAAFFAKMRKRQQTKAPLCKNTNLLAVCDACFIGLCRSI